MKRAVVTMLTCLMAVSFAACGSKEITSDGEGDTGSAAGESAQSTSEGAGGYIFETKDGVKVEIDAPMADIEDDLGEPASYFESESCAFGDLDKVWTYNGFRIDTYQLDGEDYISDVIFTDDTITTPEGVAIGDSVDAMKEAYGDPTEEDSTQAVYEKDDMKLVFLLDGDVIDTIEYMTKKLDS